MRIRCLKLAQAMLGLVLVLIPVTRVSAQCEFNAPAKAKGLKGDMVRAFVPCGNSITLAAPNSATMAGTPTCMPVTPRSSYRFGPKGSCKIRFDQRAETPCLGACGFDCANFFFQVKCRDLQTDSGVAIGEPESGAWYLQTVLRVSFDDSSNGDMTAVDFPLTFVAGTPSKGKLQIKRDLFSGAFDPCLFSVSVGPCAMTEVISMRLIDPEGYPFATLGASTR